MEYQQIFERVESKYLISQVQYDELMQKLADHIQEDGYPHSDISSVYFDSDDVGGYYNIRYLGQSVRPVSE